MQKEYTMSMLEINKVAEQILHDFSNERFLAFFGEMGAGKTTLIKALCAALGSEDNVCSPTFSIVNEYVTPDEHTSIYHFDFYRMNDIKEAFDIGYEEYFYSSHYCFVEWSEKIEELLPSQYVRVDIKPTAVDKRSVIVSRCSH